jgi:hypothetical protein
VAARAAGPTLMQGLRYMTWAEIADYAFGGDTIAAENALSSADIDPSTKPSAEEQEGLLKWLDNSLGGIIPNVIAGPDAAPPAAGMDLLRLRQLEKDAETVSAVIAEPSAIPLQVGFVTTVRPASARQTFSPSPRWSRRGLAAVRAS